MPDLELIYVADPMCSWCWGFAPSIAAIVDHHGDLPVRVVMGGLRPGAAAEPLNDGMRHYLMQAWTAVERRTGQPFDHSFLERTEWTYDTEQAAMAVVTMRQLEESQTLPFLSHVQRAFYAEGVDVTDPEVYSGLVEAFPVDRDEFLVTMQSEMTKKLTWGDFSLARRWGINGFPALLARKDEEAAYLTAGWAAPGEVDAALHAWLGQRASEPIDAPTCDLGGPIC